MTCFAKIKVPKGKRQEEAATATTTTAAAAAAAREEEEEKLKPCEYMCLYLLYTKKGILVLKKAP